MLAKFSTLSGGVFIEQVAGEADYHPRTRCFRFDDAGNSEYAYYGDLISGNLAPRWYGHCFMARDFILA